MPIDKVLVNLNIIPIHKIVVNLNIMTIDKVKGRTTNLSYKVILSVETLKILKAY